MRRRFVGAVGFVVVTAALGPVAPSIAGHARPVFHRPHTLTPAAGKLFFVAQDDEHGLELWKTAGTRASTRVVRDVHTGLESYGEAIPERLSELTRWKGYLYYSRTAEEDGGEGLWKTDGSRKGTRVVMDPPRGSWDPRDLTIFEGALYFIALSETSSEDELWKTDGTEQGTVMVVDPEGSRMHHLTRVGQKLFFATEDGNGAEAIWSSDGTAPGTERVHTVLTGAPVTPSCALIGSLYEAGGLLYFQVADGPPDAGFNECNEDLWRSDGTSEGTFKLEEFDLPQWGSHPVHELNGLALTVGRDPDHAREMWKSDGTPEGTTMIEDVSPGRGSSQVSAFTYYRYSPDPVLDGRFYFDANDGERGFEVWTSDGTEDGTKLLADIRPGEDKGSQPQTFEAIESLGLVFFVADDGRHGFELWKTDGTAAGTRMVKNINPRGGSVSPGGLGPYLTPLRNALYFFATDGVHPLELWRTDGTRRGTKRVAG